MYDFIGKITELEKLTELSKHDRLVQGTINAIEEKLLTRGDMLPSVNKMKEELGFARMTIVKAYNELKDRGIVASTNRRGYYIADDATDQTVRVALILFAFHPFQEIFYNTFREKLGENTDLRVFFHHNNIEVFESILNKIKGRYGMYVIAPIPHPETKVLLKDMPENKLLIVDRFEKLGKKYSHVTQEFENTTYQALEELAPTIQEKFKRITLCYKTDSDYPKEILHGFRRFIKDYKINGRTVETYQKGTLKKGDVFYTIGDSDLWRIIKDAKEQKLIIGQDIGIVSGNDGPVKEIIEDGITTISTDFAEMAVRAANFVHSREPVKFTVPTVLIRRNSL